MAMVHVMRASNSICNDASPQLQQPGAWARTFEAQTEEDNDCWDSEGVPPAVNKASDRLQNTVAQDGAATKSTKLSRDRRVLQSRSCLERIAKADSPHILSSLSALELEDDQVIKAAVHMLCGFAAFHTLEDATDIVRDSRKFILEVVAILPIGLQYASARLRDDVELVRIAVGQNGRALQYASARLRADAELVKAAVENVADARVQASGRPHDTEPVMAVKKRRADYESAIPVVNHAPNRFHDDVKILKAAVAQDESAIFTEGFFSRFLVDS